MTLNMVHMDINFNKLYAWGHQRRVGSDIGYLTHAAARKTFGALAPQPFVVQKEQNRLLGYTAADEDELRDAQAKAEADDPLLGQALSLPEICLRAMPAAWAVGRAYSFRVLCRPTVRFSITETDGSPTPHESDIRLRKFYLAWQNSVAAGGFTGSLAEYRRLHKEDLTAEDAYGEWLRAHLAPAAKLVNFRIAGHRSTRLTTRGSANHSGAPKTSDLRSWPETLFTGILTVADSAEFVRLIAGGVGRHKAFGYGMLLLKAVR